MGKYLDSVNYPEDIKTLNIDELYLLADEIREFIVKTVSENGGHLSSNLGTVELTLALHKVFNFKTDRIVWDVGHQSYTHKIITGRKDVFHTLRKEEGISGFPKISESRYDSFNTGHSSTSVSAALGMARARDLNNEEYKVCAVLGDGALTGGMAFEGLNDVGQTDGQILIILNDNEMSINKNVGGLSIYLNKIASKPGYNKFKKDLRKKLIKIPKIGHKLTDYLSRIKTSIKHLFTQDVIFDDLGIKYIGPVNGHNIKEMIQAVERANKIGGPVVLHVKTVKGMGYGFAENNPEEFHGIAPFDVPSGGIKGGDCKISNSSCFSEKLCELAAKNKDIVAITAAMPQGTGLNIFESQYPDRFYDVGIAEQHAVTMAAGMAAMGKIPCIAVYSTFLQRGFDQMLHDVALMNLHVVFGIDRAGVVGADGETHQGIYDISYLNMIPGFTILAPSSRKDLEAMLEYAVEEIKGPAAVRYPRNCLPEIIYDMSGNDEYKNDEYKNNEQKNDEYKNNKYKFTPESLIVREGTDITIATAGDMLQTALKAAEELEKNGIEAEVIDLRIIKPLDEKTIIKSVTKTGRIITIENNVITGGAGESILSMLHKNNVDFKIKILALPNEIIQHASISSVLKKYGLDVNGVIKAAAEWNKQ